MKFVNEIWQKMAAKYQDAFDKEVMPMANSIGFKFKKGEAKFPASLVREAIGEAYRAGAEAALKMAAELDGEE